jgi:CRP/FNR family cyclic AMP-dependent transcriptional regulator
MINNWLPYYSTKFYTILIGYFWKVGRPLIYRSIIDTVLFSGINITDSEFILSKFVERKYPKNHVIFFQGDPANEMYVIKSGCLKIYREDETKQIIMGHQFSGEMIGELECVHHDNHRLASVAALENSVLWMISKPSLEELIEIYPQILRKIIFVLSERLQQADRKLEYLAFLDSRYRVVNLLIDLYTNFGQQVDIGYLINWKITQQHFANMIGIGRESVTRVLQDLQGENVIVMKNKYITILDLPQLQKMLNQQHQSSEPRLWHSTYRYDIQ